MTNIKTPPSFDVEALRSELDRLKKDKTINERTISSLRNEIESLTQTNTLQLKRIAELEETSLGSKTLKPPVFKEEFIDSDLLQQKQTEILLERSSVRAYKNLTEELEKKLGDANKLISKLTKDFDSISRKTQGSFNPEQMGVYLSRSIDQFNKFINIDTSGVNYIINGMDVEMKALLAQKDGNMIFAMPNISSEGSEALSTIKFSIKPIPKE
jgi:prefoldin subunit 5